ALDWAGRIAGSDVLELLVAPELDIVTFFPAAGTPAAVDAASAAVLQAGMEAEDPVFLSVLRVEGRRVLRSVLMKPEHEQAVGWLHARVTELTCAALAAPTPPESV